MKPYIKAILSVGGFVTILFARNYLKRGKTMSEEIKVAVDENKLKAVRKAREQEGMPVTRESSGLTVQEKRELANRFSGMSREELEFIVSLIPAELCFQRIQKELDKAKEFEALIKHAVGSLD